MSHSPCCPLGFADAPHRFSPSVFAIFQRDMYIVPRSGTTESIQRLKLVVWNLDRAFVGDAARIDTTQTASQLQSHVRASEPPGRSVSDTEAQTRTGSLEDSTKPLSYEQFSSTFVVCSSPSKDPNFLSWTPKESVDFPGSVGKNRSSSKPHCGIANWSFIHGVKGSVQQINPPQGETSL